MAAQISSFKALAVFFFVVVGVVFLSAPTSVSAQEELGKAPAPAPFMDAGSALSLPVSPAVICSSVVLSLLALLTKH